MVLGVNPVAHVAPVAVELGAHAVDEVRDLARDELLHVLARSNHQHSHAEWETS